MNTVFADTGYWIAMSNPGDDLHSKAVSIANHLGDALIVTSQMVLAEFLTEMSRRGEFMRKVAVSAVKDILDDSHVQVIPQSDEQFHIAFELYASRSDKQWSLTDCASFLIMEDHDINEALAYDHNFEQAGFIPLLREDSISELE